MQDFNHRLHLTKVSDGLLDHSLATLAGVGATQTLGGGICSSLNFLNNTLLGSELDVFECLNNPRNHTGSHVRGMMKEGGGGEKEEQVALQVLKVASLRNRGVVVVVVGGASQRAAAPDWPAPASVPEGGEGQFLYACMTRRTTAS